MRCVCVTACSSLYPFSLLYSFLGKNTQFISPYDSSFEIWVSYSLGLINNSVKTILSHVSVQGRRNLSNWAVQTSNLTDQDTNYLCNKVKVTFLMIELCYVLEGNIFSYKVYCCFQPFLPSLMLTPVIFSHSFAPLQGEYFVCLFSFDSIL